MDREGVSALRVAVALDGGAVRLGSAQLAVSSRHNLTWRADSAQRLRNAPFTVSHLGRRGGFSDCRRFRRVLVQGRHDIEGRAAQQELRTSHVLVVSCVAQGVRPTVIEHLREDLAQVQKTWRAGRKACLWTSSVGPIRTRRRHSGPASKRSGRATRYAAACTVRGFPRGLTGWFLGSRAVSRNVHAAPSDAGGPHSKGLAWRTTRRFPRGVAQSVRSTDNYRRVMKIRRRGRTRLGGLVRTNARKRAEPGGTHLRRREARQVTIWQLSARRVKRRRPVRAWRVVELHTTASKCSAAQAMGAREANAAVFRLSSFVFRLSGRIRGSGRAPYCTVVNSISRNPRNRD
ncbi:hypothetical protein CERSUDRAFT_110009 [Gelatoporia subvermispora B]|uniref:Uncharacterized protein n=1 Tax=Ceriporiopsis subvermispora (strain B) TaxID=914234 RepID=M2QWH3_CERS8|nr:hypothetical protein CERSUDRAFT_110009 [Gelatoporia subvermispora B]